jgi:selenocysteine lyase/cysteine desulfurase
MPHSRIPRRSFLALASATTGACASPRGAASPVTGSSAAASPAATSPVVASATAPPRWEAFRGEFKLARDRVHLAGLLFASYPRVVREAIDRYRDLLDVDPVEALEHDLVTGESTNATLDAAARYLGVVRDEIALTDSTTSGLALVYGGLTLRAGDEIVTTKHDHWVTHESLRLAAERSGATVRTVALYDKPIVARVDEMAKRVEAALSPSTRVLAVTWVHSSTGVKIPVHAISEVVARVNAPRAPRDRILLCVDGVHGFGVENATMTDLGCDVFIAGCHKWLFGPHGTGIVWARPDAWERIQPTSTPFHIGYVMAREYGVASVPKADGRTRTPGGFRAFEHRWALREAFDLHLALGKANVEARIHDLARRCKMGLASMPHVTLHTPMDAACSAGIACFELTGSKPDAVMARLRTVGIVGSTTPYQPSYARFTPGLINSPEEIDRALAEVRKL